MKISYATLLLVLLSSSCSHTPNRFIGDWVSENPFPGVFMWSVGESNIVATGVGSVITWSYTVDCTKEPIHVDLWSDKKTSRCIVEFLGNDRFRIVGEDNSEKERPSSFDTNNPHAEIILFKRKRAVNN